MKRTKYVDVTRSLAKALHFNYVYGVEFIELERRLSAGIVKKQRNIED